MVGSLVGWRRRYGDPFDANRNACWRTCRAGSSRPARAKEVYGVDVRCIDEQFEQVCKIRRRRDCRAEELSALARTGEGRCHGQFVLNRNLSSA